MNNLTRLSRFTICRSWSRGLPRSFATTSFLRNAPPTGSPSSTASAPSPATPPPPKRYKRIVYVEEEDTRPEIIQKISRVINLVKNTYYGYAHRNPFLFYGLPFMTFMVLASFYLTEFTEIRYKAYDRARTLTPESELIPSTKQARKPLSQETREEYYERQMKLLNTNDAKTDYDMKRIERRAEEPPVRW
ncbi:cytochrome c oxidase assembly protein COX16-domain-containing protein [Myxozyma melibiosi]|uniref:Cytochrome c oxidase assembly protein COX16, mitochondrial n=1 Tax=Myxozyma melibiosi TaxID=54550 RepID=A0ABR1F6Q1_9ASCO